MFAVAIAGVCRAVQVSFKGPAPHCPSAASSDQVGGVMTQRFAIVEA